MKHKLAEKSVAKQPSNRGFALIATIVIMSLLLLIAMAFLGISTTEARTSRIDDADAQAKANAKLALMIAIGELQESVGPDKRITANAAILDDNTSTLGVDGVANPQWTGVWRSFDGWLTGRDTSNSTIQSTYTKGRESHFMKYLVSHRNSDSLDSIDFAKTELPSDQSVVLVGGVRRSTSSRVVPSYKAGLIEVAGIEGSNQTSGHYAWGVIDENVKARINDFDRDLAGNANQGASDTQMRFGNVSRSGLEWLEGLESTPSSPTDWLNLDKIVSLPTGSQLDAGDAAYKKAIDSYIYDLSTYSASLPINVRNAGFKNDLNLLLERRTLPQDLDYGHFRRGNPVKGLIRSIRPYTSDIRLQRRAASINLTSWYKLHQFYRMAHADSADEAAFDMPAMGFQKGLYWTSSSVPGLDFYWHNGNMDEYGTARGPIVSRAMLIFSVSGTGSQLNISVKPVITLWNPYNVPLKISPQRLIFRHLAIQFRATSGNAVTGWRPFTPPAPRGLGWFRVYISASGTPGDRNPLILQPGENRLFSGSNDFVGGEVQASSTYSASAVGASVNVWPDVTRFPNFSGKSPTDVEMAFRIIPSGNTGFGQYYWFLANGITDIAQRHNEFATSLTPGLTVIPLVEDSPGKRIRVTTRPQSIAAFQFVLKSSEDVRNPAPIDGKDYRCKNWVHANPTNRRSLGGSPIDRMLGMSQHQFQIITGSGNTINPDFQAGPNGTLLSFMGTKVNTAAAPSYAPQTHCPAKEFPSTPICNLASLMHFPTNPGYTDVNTGHHLWDISANSRLAIGNSFAHPMIDSDKIFKFHEDAKAQGSSFPAATTIRDYHDHGLLNNDALWDNWFCSSITAQQEGPFYTRRSTKTVFNEFNEGTRSLPFSRLEITNNGNSNFVDDFFDGSEPKEIAHKRIAKHLIINGGFNVNSTSKTAWKALFTGLKGRAITWYDKSSRSVKTESFPDKLAISRFSMANSIQEGTNAGDPASWDGIRLLTEEQIDKLAEECVRQVKLRGPFLNMSDFINRRLSSDNELARVGMLQAAIDWDEFNGNSPSSSDNSSINGRYKNRQDMMKPNTWGVPFPEANLGSYYTGITGYVTQADLLKGIGNQLTPRSDTFTIRAYGDAVDPRTGQVVARAWCEAVVRRTANYVDPTDSPDSYHVNQQGLSTYRLSATNRKYGRQLKVISFKWLSKEEI